MPKFGKRVSRLREDHGETLRRHLSLLKPEVNVLELEETPETAALADETQESEAPSPQPREPDKSQDQATAMTKERLEFIEDVKVKVFDILVDELDLAELRKLEEEEKRREISFFIEEIIKSLELALLAEEEAEVTADLIRDLLGLGPLDILISRDDITDIMVNGYDRIYVELAGKIQLTNVRFRDQVQLMNICTRIATRVGRRVDEASPICDARLEDGSRVNIIIPPLSIKSPILTIRKFYREKIALDDLVSLGALSPEAAKALAIFANCRCNILVSGGTGSGKTTMLNALSNEIDSGERIITVEDTVELQLQQPHVCQLETRPPNLEGMGRVTQRDLVINCLRMRPDRIILGEVRGGEAFDMLQAMNTGHAGSMSTIHANSPRDALTRLEDMVAITGFELPSANVQKQIASALDLIVQVERLRDGTRKVTYITEIAGMEETIITLQNLFTFEQEGEDDKGMILGELRSTGLRPYLAEKAAKFGREAELMETVRRSEFPE
jgi:pilus assembly protein CpaF|tara:strand:- start:5352 stop:6854 length:1503 start_codon:yes stop_codon:yes gene_type:complete